MEKFMKFSHNEYSLCEYMFIITLIRNSIIGNWFLLLKIMLLVFYNIYVIEKNTYTQRNLH